MKTLKFVFPVYAGDERHIVESVKCLRHAEPKSDIVVADDCFSPICADSRRELVNTYKCKYIQTGYNRNGNLLGPANLIGQTAMFVDISEDCDVLVKLDADTMLIKTEWLHDFADNHPEAVMCGIVQPDNPHWIYGQAYGIRAEQLPALAEDAKRVLAHRDAFEDYEVSTRLFRLNGCRLDYAVRHPLNPATGFVLTTLEQANETFANAVCCNFGYDLQSTLLEKRKMYKDKQLNLMQQINEQIFRASMKN